MRLSFSTLGCPELTFPEIITLAKDLRFDGIEVRGVCDTVEVDRCAAFAPDKLDETLARLKETGLSLAIFTAGASIGVPELAESGMAEAKRAVDLAARAGVPYVRVMAAPTIMPDPRYDETLTLANYRTLCDCAAAAGVQPLLETNGQLADSRAMAALLAKTERENAGALWDVHHPFRFFHESPEETCRRLAPYIRHVHVKDSVPVGDTVKYRMLGCGNVPVESAVRALAGIGYGGFISLEWVKRWEPELEEPGVVFYHFKNYMDDLMRQ